MAFKPMEESTYIAYLRIVGWSLAKAGIDYSLFDEKGTFVCTIKIGHGKLDRIKFPTRCDKLRPMHHIHIVFKLTKERGSVIQECRFKLRPFSFNKIRL